MGDPLISVIVPIYNVEKYLPECVESICGQTYRNLQIILVDDGSTDLSGMLCDKYAKLDKRIVVIHQQNCGVVVARKRGLDKAEGVYIGFVDGDDSIETEMYAKLLEEIQIANADFVHSGYIQNKRKKVPFSKRVINFSKIEEKEQLLKAAVFGDEMIITPSMWSKLYKAEFIKNCFSQVPDDVLYGEDLINLCICIEKCSCIALADEAFYHYRYRTNSATNEKEFRSLENLFKCYSNLRKVLMEYEHYQELKDCLMEKMCKSILNKVNDIFGNDFQIERYFFPDPDNLQGKRIVLYGAGVIGKDYYAQISRYTDCQIVAWVDAHPEKYQYPYIKICGVDVLLTLEFDIILIAVKEENTAKDIYNQLREACIEESKISWSKPHMYEIRSK